jgi:uncharacterized protein
MSNHAEIYRWLQSTVPMLVTHPGDVQIKFVADTTPQKFSITVNSADIGELIGKQGRTARALRTLALVMGMRTASRFQINIVDHRSLKD